MTPDESLRGAREFDELNRYILVGLKDYENMMERQTEDEGMSKYCSECGTLITAEKRGFEGYRRDFVALHARIRNLEEENKLLRENKQVEKGVVRSSREQYRQGLIW